MLGLQTIGRQTHTDVLRQVDHKLWQKLPGQGGVQADQMSPVAGPATHQVLVADRKTVRAGQFGEQHTEEICRAMRAAPEWIESIGNRECDDPPFLGSGVITMQIKSQARRQLASGTLVLDQGQTSIINAALHSLRSVQQVRGVDCCAVKLGAMSIGPSHF